MRNRLSRRRLFSLIAAMSAALGLGAEARAGDVGTEDVCYWRRMYDYRCREGLLRERWCEYCNDPGTGATIVRCEWRPAGTC